MPGSSEPRANPFAEAAPLPVRPHAGSVRIAHPAKRPFSAVARRARQRPVDSHPDVLVILVPPELPLSRFLVAKAIAATITLRLHSADSLDYALKVACGIDSIVEMLEFLGRPSSFGPGFGVPHRSTIRRALQDLEEAGVFDFVGELDPWYDREAEQRKRGAYVYAPSRDTIRSGFGPTTYAAVSRTRGSTRPENCLKWAIENAQPGQRNQIGHWLTCRSIEAGLSEGETMKLMRVYREAVPQSPPYTAGEVIATVRSRFRRGPRRVGVERGR